MFRLLFYLFGGVKVYVLNWLFTEQRDITTGFILIWIGMSFEQITLFIFPVISMLLASFFLRQNGTELKIPVWDGGYLRFS